MNIELVMASFILFFGIKGVYKTLNAGSPETFIEKQKRKLEGLEKSAKNTGAYFVAWLLSLAIGGFLIYVSLSWLLPHFN